MQGEGEQEGTVEGGKEKAIGNKCNHNKKGGGPEVKGVNYEQLENLQVT